MASSARRPSLSAAAYSATLAGSDLLAKLWNVVRNGVSPHGSRLPRRAGPERAGWRSAPSPCWVGRTTAARQAADGPWRILCRMGAHFPISLRSERDIRRQNNREEHNG